jgi:hypothetical protein
MLANGTVIDVSFRGAMACAMGGVISLAQPALLPGVVLMCLVIVGLDL